MNSLQAAAAAAEADALPTTTTTTTTVVSASDSLYSYSRAAAETHHASSSFPPEIASAYRDAKARGLPDGWTCSIDKRHRRKWTAPDGRSCDSIPKALAISVDLGLLPPDTVVPTGPIKRKRPNSNNTTAFGGGGRPRKMAKKTNNSVVSLLDDSSDRHRHRHHDANAALASLAEASASAEEAIIPAKSTLIMTSSQSTKTAKKPIKEVEEEEEEEDEDDDEDEEEELDDDEILQNPHDPSEPFMDPENALNPHKSSAPASTVHWDPYGPDGSKIGCIVKIAVTAAQAAAAPVGAIITTTATTTNSSSNSSDPSVHHLYQDERTHWLTGRIVKYDPYTHKHKIDFTPDITIPGYAATAAAGPKKRGPKSKKTSNSSNSSCWIWLRNQEHHIQVATRIVWAKVKGYAFWPALVMESNQKRTNSSRGRGGSQSSLLQQQPKDGYVLVEFFGSGETSTLRDASDCVRPFSGDPRSALDPVVARHKKKRNAQAYEAACAEYAAVQACRNAAAIEYAQRALEMTQSCCVSNSNNKQPLLVGRRVQLHRTDVNYPYGDSLTAKIRKYSVTQKKWLLTYDISERTKTKYDASWINLYGKKECTSVKVVSDKNKSNTNTNTAGEQQQKQWGLEELVPYLVGYEYDHAAEEEGEASASSDSIPNNITGSSSSALAAAAAAGEEESPLSLARRNTAELAVLLSKHCRGCVEYFKTDDIRLACDECGSDYHIGCIDPPVSVEAWQKLCKERAAASAAASGGGSGSEDENEGDDDDDDENVNAKSGFVCARCVPCRGCYQKDAVFGSHAYSCPPTLSFPKGETLALCSMCTTAYNDGHFCPNCAHTWDHDKFQLVTQQMEYAGAFQRKRRGGSGKGDATICDTTFPPVFGWFSGDEVLPPGAKVHPSYFHPETSEWGYGENDMLVCDNCDVWVHAGCSGMDEAEYEQTADEKHPIYSKEFLCRVCCRQRCKEIIEALQEQDTAMLFAVPVTEKMAPNYNDVIRQPMDLQTMLEKSESDEYPNYVWVRELFELMVLNALTFNRFHTGVWYEAKRYYLDCLENVFGSACLGKAAPPGKYDKAVRENFDAADLAQKMEEDRVQVDQSVEKKDLVAGSLAASVTLPKLRESAPDQSSCLPFTEVKLKATDAFYCAWMDCCYTCGSSGAMDTMVFCVDCGEAFHTFCANVPVHSMDELAAAGWRCPNCKICEISGDVPQDENRMLVCEMCDRGFSLDLLDPPLESAPPGIWVCGQCVDCQVCGNTTEEGGRNLAHWSRDPDKCFRCGGCEGLVDDSFRCTVCTTLLRDTDENVVRCSSGCSGAVHAACHFTAKDHLVKMAWKLRGEPDEEYICPACKPSTAPKASLGDPREEAKMLSNLAWTSITCDGLQPHENYSEAELYSKLVEEMNWKIRDLWRDEYLALIREGLRIYSLAATSFGDSRIIVQHALSASCNLPMFTIQRALRFIYVVRRSKWDSGSFSPDRIESIVHSAKLAAAFLDVAHAVLRVDIDPEIRSSDRLQALLQAPDENGNSLLPVERIRTTKEMDAHAKTLVQAKPANDVNSPTDESVSVKIAAPLCGWSCLSSIPRGAFDWKDPRECCLCHICGDDDAGPPCSQDYDIENNESGTTHLGRLLPMSDGCFVHTSCALWSSEVWEDVVDGMIHAVEKAKCRGSQLKCFGCGFYGATVGCNKSNCLFNYHFPCAKACGAVFTTNQHVFCSNHNGSVTTEILRKESYEHMKALMIAPEKKATVAMDPSDGGEADLCFRVGSLVVHSLGEIEGNCDGFHTENYIMPPGYIATRIFWSSVHPRSRTSYVLKIERSAESDGPLFTILPGDAPSCKITGATVSQVYSTLLDRVRKLNSAFFSQGDPLSKLPVVRRTRRKTFGLNGPQFFGFGLDHIRKMLEASPGVEAVVAPLTESSPKYRFCFRQPSIESVKDLIRRRAAAKHERSLENSSGCARTEGIKAVAQSGGSGRITRALVRNAAEEVAESATAKKGEEMNKAAKSMNQLKYKRMKSVPMEQRLAARRSHIHGWGLFSKIEIAKDDPIVEYMGEEIRQNVADKRERAYEISGEGSCYMFRLDRQRIVDATMVGCMARFMNHSCQPNAYAKIINVDREGAQERKIVIFANRNITPGEEITYDYKFPVEDGSLRCTCGAPNCIGRLN